MYEIRFNPAGTHGYSRWMNYAATLGSRVTYAASCWTTSDSEVVATAKRCGMLVTEGKA